jgi:hypothetical protein
VPQERDSPQDYSAGAENQTLSPGLNRLLELGSPIEESYQAIDVDQARSSKGSGQYVRLLQPYYELVGSRIVIA